jgi:hypothetical protein
VGRGEGEGVDGIIPILRSLDSAYECMMMKATFDILHIGNRRFLQIGGTRACHSIFWTNAASFGLQGVMSRKIALDRALVGTDSSDSARWFIPCVRISQRLRHAKDIRRHFQDKPTGYSRPK